MISSSAFINLLVHPITKTPLIYDGEKDQLYDQQSGERFIVKEKVPILLTQNPNENITNTKKHISDGVQFDYKAHYQTDATVYDYFEKPTSSIELEEINRLHQTIIARIPEDAHWILDVGCGGAWLAENLTPKARNVISMDISDVNPLKAIKQIQNPFHFALVADVFNLPFKENSIDCIIASEIIEHVPNPKTFIQVLLQILKPDGVLIITTPYNENIRTSLCIHCNCITPQNAHLHSFTEKSIKSLIPQNTKRVNTSIFNSKLLVKTYIQKALKFLPLNLWRLIDRFTIYLTSKKAYRLMVEIKK